MKAYEAPEMRLIAVEPVAVLLASTGGLIDGGDGGKEGGDDGTITIHSVGGIEIFR